MLRGAQTWQPCFSTWRSGTSLFDSQAVGRSPGPSRDRTLRLSFTATPISSSHTNAGCSQINGLCTRRSWRASSLSCPRHPAGGRFPGLPHLPNHWHRGPRRCGRVRPSHVPAPRPGLNGWEEDHGRCRRLYVLVFNHRFARLGILWGTGFIALSAFRWTR